MVGKFVKLAAGAACVMALTCGAANAQDLKIAHTVPTPKSENVPMKAPPPATVKLFSNLSTSVTDVYNDTTGYYVLGPTNTVGDSEQWIGVPFTVTKAGDTITVTEVETAIGALAAGGGGKFTLAIQADDGSGSPSGTNLGSGSGNATVVFGTCCTTTNATISPAVVITSGAQYWVVAQTIDSGRGSNPAFTAVWSASNLGNVDGLNVAGNEAIGGWSGFSANVPAVAVLGTEVAP